MPKREVKARDALATQQIAVPLDVALWARKRGLSSVYILYVPARGFLPACWQVVWPGHRTAADGPAWQRGNKSWTVRSVSEKNRFESAARAWAGAQYDISDWMRIEGLGGALFPSAVVEELKRYLPELVVTRQRQHTGKRLTHRNH